LRKRPRDLKGTHDAQVHAPVRLDVPNVLSFEPDGTGVRRDDAGKHVEQRALAGTVRPNETDARSAIDFAANIVGDYDGTVPLVEMINFEQWAHLSSRPAISLLARQATGYQACLEYRQHVSILAEKGRNAKWSRE
jgi:hypothetical protein